MPGNEIILELSIVTTEVSQKSCTCTSPKWKDYGYSQSSKAERSFSKTRQGEKKTSFEKG